jgi:hypothetical protein
MDSKGIGDLMKDLSLAAVMDVIPMRAAQKALEETGRQSVRQRLLPAHLVVYLVILLAFFAEVSVRENLRILMDALRRRFGMDPFRTAVGSAITKARGRLGRAPFEHLFNDVAWPLGEEALPACFYRSFRIVAADGTSVEVQNTPENRERYGIHTNQHGAAGYPAMKAVVLMECGTRAPLAAAVGGEHDGEGELFDQLHSRVDKGMLLLLDRYYYSFERFQACAERAGGLLWRVKKNLNLRPITRFEDGSFLAEVRPSNKLTRTGRSMKHERMTVRVIPYEAEFENGTTGEPTRLITTLLDPAEAPAEELARLYAERWREETGFNEIKTYLKGAGRVLRSQLPDLVEQEFFGFLLADYAVRATMVQAAKKNGVAPVELSFVHAVRVIRRKLAIPPSGQEGSRRRV